MSTAAERRDHAEMVMAELEQDALARLNHAGHSCIECVHIVRSLISDAWRVGFYEGSNRDYQTREQLLELCRDTGAKATGGGPRRSSVSSARRWPPQIISVVCQDCLLAFRSLEGSMAHRDRRCNECWERRVWAQRVIDQASRN